MANEDGAGSPTLTKQGMGLVSGLPLEIADESPGALRDAIQMLLENQLRALIVPVDDQSHFFIDGVSGLVGDTFRLRDAVAEEHFILVFAVHERTKVIRQTPFSDHVASK